MSKKITPLQALDQIKEQLRQDGIIHLFDMCNVTVVETALRQDERVRQLNCKLLEQKNTLRAERDKYKKVLEIIRCKNPDLCLLKTADNFQKYIDYCAMRNEITEQEYDLLKEMLK